MGQQSFRKNRLLDRIQMVVDYENSRTRIMSKELPKLEAIESDGANGFTDFQTRVSSVRVGLPSSVLFRRS
jgi:hypothetical protein